jgi:7-keto-8-aminopelargonate synthetase-like enzyme
LFLTACWNSRGTYLLFLEIASIASSCWEQKIAGFFRKEHAIIYTTGYISNSASLQCILTKDDLVILDAGVHTSVMEGCQLVNRKTVRHNDLNAYEHMLKMSKLSRLFNSIVLIH